MYSVGILFYEDQVFDIVDDGIGNLFYGANLVIYKCIHQARASTSVKPLDTAPKESIIRIFSPEGRYKI